MDMMRGQIVPTANTVTDLATCPAGRVVHGPTINIHNTDLSNPAQYWCLVAFGGATTAAKQYVCSAVVIGPGATVSLTIPMTLQAADVIRVKANTATVNFAIQQPATTR